MPPPPSTGAYFQYKATAPVFKTSYQTAGSLSLPAGKYVVNATATAHDDDDNETTVECRLYEGATLLGGSAVWGDDVVDSGSPDASAQGTIAITAATTLGADGIVDFQCSSTRGNDSLNDVALTAFEVDTIATQ